MTLPSASFLSRPRRRAPRRGPAASAGAGGSEMVKRRRARAALGGGGSAASTPARWCAEAAGGKGRRALGAHQRSTRRPRRARPARRRLVGAERDRDTDLRSRRRRIRRLRRPAAPALRRSEASGDRHRRGRAAGPRKRRRSPLPRSAAWLGTYGAAPPITGRSGRGPIPQSLAAQFECGLQ